MLPELGPPETTCWEFPGTDRSWDVEFAHLVECIETGKPPCGDVTDALAALEIIDQLYAMSRS
jgi:predicted dehydrogenase